MSWLEKVSSRLSGNKQQPGTPAAPEAPGPGGTVVHAGGAPALTIKRLRERIKAGDMVAGNLEIKQLLGRGGMGEVWLARQTQWGTDVAVKIPNDQMLADAENRHRIAREAEAWTDLGLHPNIAYCHYAQPLDELLLLVIEYIDGGNLRDWIADGRCVDLKAGLNLAIQFCHGLERAHSRGLVHRDIKPENVLLTKDGTVKVTDFGIVRKTGFGEERGPVPAQDLRKPVVAGMTMVAIGTDEYMAPEQWGQQEGIDHRVDIFAFGVCLYEMFCGRRPYAITAGARQETPEPAELRQDSSFPAHLSELMKRCVDWDRERRPEDAKAVRAELLAAYEEVAGEPNPLAELPELVALADDWNNRALSYLALGKEAEAEQAWQTALEADARHPESTYNFGLVQWRTGKTTDHRLLLALRGIAENEPSAWLPQYLMAQVHLERGDAEGAKEELRRIPSDEGSRSQVAEAKLAADGLLASNKRVHTLEGHTANVHCVSLSTDGRYGMSGSWDKTLKLWEVQSGSCLRTFEGHTDAVLSVSLSADGRYALSGSWDKTLKLWEVQSGRCLRTFEGSNEEVGAVSLSADGRYALSASRCTMKSWEVGTGRCLRTSDAHSAVESVSLSADGRYGVSGSQDKTLKLWEMQSGRCLRTFEGHTGAVESVSLSADGQYALSGSRDRTMKLWEVGTGRCVRTFEGHGDCVASVSLTADRLHALSGSGDTTARLWEVESGRCLRTFEGHKTWVMSVALSADGRYALSGNQTPQVKLWEAVGGSMPYQATHRLSHSADTAQVVESSVRYHDALVKARQAADSGEDFAACRSLRTARQQLGQGRASAAVFEWGRLYTRLRRRGLSDSWCCWSNRELEHGISFKCFSADGRYAVSGGARDRLKLWEVESGRCLRTFEEQTELVECVSLTPDVRFAISGTWDGALKLWDAESGRCRRIFEQDAGWVCAVAVSADGRYALSGSYKNPKLWDVRSGRCLRTFEGHSEEVLSVSLDPAARYALSGSVDLKLWEVETGRCLRAFEGDASTFRSVTLSTDGRYALSGSDDRLLRLWDVGSGRCLRTFDGHAGLILSVGLSVDGRHALSSSTDNTVKLWDVERGGCLRTIELGSPVQTISISADWRYLLVAAADGLSRWFLDWDLEENQPADWDEGARPYLTVFLRAHQPYAAVLTQDREPTDEEVTLALTRRGRPVWTEQDFQSLLYALGCAGYGWLRPRGVRRELEVMTAEWKDEE